MEVEGGLLHRLPYVDGAAPLMNGPNEFHICVGVQKNAQSLQFRPMLKHPSNLSTPNRVV